MELVDVLTPPTFNKSGQVKTRQQAIQDKDWKATFNLWILQTQPTPSIVLQKRSARSTWAPNKLDVSAGGHYQAGESLLDGLREAKEELGKEYDPESLFYLGRKLHVGPSTKGEMHYDVVEIFFVVDDSPLDSYTLDPVEVAAIGSFPLKHLLQVHRQELVSFSSTLLMPDGETEKYEVSHDSFPYNWDQYHYKVALLAQRYLQGEREIMY